MSGFASGRAHTAFAGYCAKPRNRTRPRRETQRRRRAKVQRAVRISPRLSSARAVGCGAGLPSGVAYSNARLQCRSMSNPVHASVAFLRIPEFAELQVSEQASRKEHLEARVRAGLARVANEDRLVLDA